MLRGGQSKQAVIKSRVSAMIAVFMVLNPLQTQPFPHPLFSIPKANFHTRQPVSSAKELRVTVHVCVCVLHKPSASLRPIKKKSRKPNSSQTSKQLPREAT